MSEPNDIKFCKNRVVLFLGATKQLYEWFSLPVCPSVRLPVRLSHLFDYVPIIVSLWNFQELLPMADVTSTQKVKVQRSKVKVTEVKPNLAVSGPYLQFEFTYDSEMIQKAWWCLGEMPYCFSRSSFKFHGYTGQENIHLTQICRHQISRSHGTKNCQFWPELYVSGL